MSIYLNDSWLSKRKVVVLAVERVCDLHWEILSCGLSSGGWVDSLKSFCATLSKITAALAKRLASEEPLSNNPELCRSGLRLCSCHSNKILTGWQLHLAAEVWERDQGRAPAGSPFALAYLELHSYLTVWKHGLPQQAITQKEEEGINLEPAHSSIFLALLMWH